MLEKLKAEVLAANLELPARGLVTYTWGNVSGIDRQQGLVVIKPSVVSYEKLQVDYLVVVDLAGNIKEGKLTPSSDTATHLVLYREFENIGGVVHTHSTWATIWSQLGRKIPPCGTTHADYFYGDIPCTRKLSGEEIHRDYEQETGLVIAETMTGMNPQHCPAVLVNDHGPFSWGETPAMAVHNAVVLEEVAKMAYYTELMQQKNSMDKVLMNKHFLRKHGENAYYGQR